MNILKELRYLNYLLTLSKWLYFAKKVISVVAICIFAMLAVSCLGGCKGVMKNCKS